VYQRSRSGLLSFVLSVLALAAAALPSIAQESAALTGRVTDVSGAVVAGAMVTVKSLETGASRTVTTDDSGDYTVLGLSALTRSPPISPASSEPRPPE
jgi:hypothetical protein